MATIRSFGGLRGRGSRKRAPANNAPAPTLASVVDCAVYVDGERLPGHYTHTEAVEEVTRRGEGFTWVGLHEPDAEQIQGIAETFGLHELAVEDAVHAHQRPKLERYDDVLFMVFKTLQYLEHESPDAANEIVDTGEIMAFVGREFIVTVRHGSHSSLAKIRRALENDTEQLAYGPSAVLHAIADHVVDGYLSVAGRVQDDIDDLEKQVFSRRPNVNSETMYVMKREILEMRRAVLPLATPLRRLAEGYSRVVNEEIRSYFRDVDDHVNKVSEQVNGFDELLTSLLDTAAWQISLQQSTDMRKITSWAAIFAVPTMIAGVYGMNFDVMPELHWNFSYPVVLLVILIVCLLLYRAFRRNRWL